MSDDLNFGVLVPRSPCTAISIAKRMSLLLCCVYGLKLFVRVIHPLDYFTFSMEITHFKFRTSAAPLPLKLEIRKCSWSKLLFLPFSRRPCASPITTLFMAGNILWYRGVVYANDECAM